MRLPSLMAFATTLISISACDLDYESAKKLVKERRGFGDWAFDTDMDFEMSSEVAKSQLLTVSFENRWPLGAPPGLSMMKDQFITFEHFMNIEEIYIAMKKFQTDGHAAIFETPTRTQKGRRVYGLQIFPKNIVPSELEDSDLKVMIVTQIHPRERGAADSLIMFISDLLHASEKKIGLEYGTARYTYEQVRKVMNIGIVAIPVPNPDGLIWDHHTNSCWRKNRRGSKSNAPEDNMGPIGVDLNRNFNFLWDYKKHFVPGYEPASDDPNSEMYQGPSPGSEPEVRNIVWTLDEHRGVTHFVDVHSYGSMMMYPWGHSQAQTTSPRIKYANPEWDGKRGGSEYLEFIRQSDERYLSFLSKSIATRVSENTDVPWDAKPAVDVYPIAGDAMDFVHSRHYEDSRRRPIRSVQFELGLPNLNWPECPFYPNSVIYHQRIQEGAIAYMELLLRVSDHVRWGFV
ncbi:hypothetical protein BROUX41_001711 [Berkeleyomyces rouxiae]|uniref:uncharacterized protein n=1 Tax=Berkeleyomyces rouxiae TaxID=2035830 RepID=UPI003B821048